MGTFKLKFDNFTAKSLLFYVNSFFSLFMDNNSLIFIPSYFKNVVRGTEADIKVFLLAEFFYVERNSHFDGKKYLILKRRRKEP